jgi:hypothetical protein
MDDDFSSSQIYFSQIAFSTDKPVFPTKKNMDLSFPFVENWHDFPQHKNYQSLFPRRKVWVEFSFRGKLMRFSTAQNYPFFFPRRKVR